MTVSREFSQETPDGGESDKEADGEDQLSDGEGVLSIKFGAKDLESGCHDVTSLNCTHWPGINSAGGSRSTSHSTASVCPINCHPPGDSRG